MLQNNKNQLKPDLGQRKYLILNPTRSLEAVVTSRITTNDDLVIQQLEEGISSVLRDGKQIVEFLNKLTNQHGYCIALYSHQREQQMIRTLESFDEACKREGLAGFPKITAIIVKDYDCYPQIRANDPKNAKSKSHGILIAGYSLQPVEETDLLDGLSGVLSFSKSDWKNYIVLDHRSSFIKNAKREGWNNCNLSSIPLKKVLNDLCLKADESQLQSSQPHVKEHEAEEARGDPVKGNTERKLDTPLEACESNPLQSSMGCQQDRNPQKPEIEISENYFDNLENKIPFECASESQKQQDQQNQEEEDGSKKYASSLSSSSDTNNMIPLTTTEHQCLQNQKKLRTPEPKNTMSVENKTESVTKTDYSVHEIRKDQYELASRLSAPQSSQQDLEIDTKETELKLYNEEKTLLNNHENLSQSVDNLQNQAVDNEVKALADSSDSFYHSSLISDRKFRALKKPENPGGSSITRWFADESSESEWVGKCTYSSLYMNNSFDEHKELLASKIYQYFGVLVPETTLTALTLDEEFQKNNLCSSFQKVEKPKVHVISRVMPGFELVGSHFIENYKTASKTDYKQLFYIDRKQIGRKPLRGFGRVMAIAIFIYDYDFIGNSGSNIGCILGESAEYFEILKIDPGEALTASDDLDEAPSVYNDLEKKEAVAGTHGKRINFYELNKPDQQEFVQTLKRILEAKESELEDLFLPFLEADRKFRKIFEELLTRRRDFLTVFYVEVESALDLDIQNLEEKRAQQLMPNWNKLPVLISSELKQKSELIRNKAQLEAFAVATTIISKASRVSNPLQNHEKFVGRDPQLAQIKELFTSNSGIAVCAIVGGAGLGKSQLAIEYVSRNQKEMYSRVWRLHAEQSDSIADQIQIYLETCYHVKVDNHNVNRKTILTKKFYQTLSNENAHLSKSPKKHLIVFDNAENLPSITDYLPNKENYPELKVDILITSRYKKWENPVRTIIEMQSFSVEETKNYLGACLSNPDQAQNDDLISTEAQKLNDLLGGLPLAISLAVAYIQQSGISLTTFCDSFVGVDHKPVIPLEPHQIPNEGSDESKSLGLVSTVLTLALADLRIKNSNVMPILDLIAYLSPDNINKSLLKDCWRQCGKEKFDFQWKALERYFIDENVDLSELEMWRNFVNINKEGIVKDIDQKNETFDEAFELMISYSLLTFDPRSLVSNQGSENHQILNAAAVSTEIKMHRLTQQVIRLNHQKSKIFEAKLENILDWALAGLSFNRRDLKDIKRAEVYVPHAMHLERFSNNTDQQKIAFLFSLIGGHQYQGVGKYNTAFKYFAKSLELNEKFYSKGYGTQKPLDTSQTILGISKEKFKMFEVLKLRWFSNHSSGELKDHPQIAADLNNLANVCGSLGDYQKQKELLVRALEINEKNFSKDSRNVALALDNLSIALKNLGEFNQAKDLLTRALKINKKVYGKDHYRTGLTLKELGIVSGSLGDFEKQRDLCSQALELIRNTYGDDHYETGLALKHLGFAWKNLGKYEKAKDFFINALAIFKKHYGKDSVQTGTALGNLGLTWISLGEYEKAKDLFTQELQIYGKNNVHDHPFVGMALANLGKVWIALTDYEKAQELLAQTLEIFEKSFPPDHPHIRETKILINYVTQHINLPSRFLSSSIQSPVENKLMPISRKKLSWHELVNNYRQKEQLIHKLGKRLRKCNSFSRKAFALQIIIHNSKNFEDFDAEFSSYLMSSTEDAEKNSDKNYPFSIGILLYLASLGLRLGQYLHQKKLLHKALAIAQQTHGKNHPLTGIILTKLGTAYLKTCDVAGSLQCQKKALEIFKVHFGETHKFSKYSIKNLK